MADPAKIMERVRSFGANVVIDGGRLKIINGKKLPKDATAFIAANAAAIADWLDREAEVEERSAILEHDGKTPREVAEAFARLCIKHMTEGWSELDRSWAITRCAAIIDEVAALGTEARAA